MPDDRPSPAESARTDTVAAAPTQGTMSGDVSNAVRPAALTFDFQDYRQYVEDPELSEIQQQQLLAALWEIIVGFVDLGFKIHPIQQAMKDTNDLAADSRSVLASKDISNSTHIARADRINDGAERMDS